MNRISISSATLAASFAVLLAACSQGQDGQGHGMGNMPPMPVGVVTLSAQSVPVVFEYTGQTAGSKEVEVRARTGGILERRLYEEGSMVQAGQVMFELDPKPLQAQVAAAEADVATAQARADQSAREAARLKPLLADRAVSQQDYDNAISNDQISKASLLSAKAHLQQVQLDLGYTKVTAPVSGFAGRMQKSEGSLVSTTDSLLTTIVQLNPLYVSFGPSENEQNDIERDVASGELVLPKNKAFSVELRGTDGSTLAKGGRLNFTDSRVSNQTGTVDMRAEIANPNGQLKAGQFVRVALHGATRPAALVVPQSAVIEGATGKSVLVAVEQDGHTTFATRPVEVGEWAQLGSGPDSRVWVIRKGLQAGDKVIVDNLVKLTRMPPGVPISPVPAGAAEQSAPAAAK